MSPRDTTNASRLPQAHFEPQKKNFVSHLFRPFRKGDHRPVKADLRFPICKKGHCACLEGKASGKNGVCTMPVTESNGCESNGYWNGGVCVPISDFRFSNCSSLLLLMQQQEQRMELAQASQQISCFNGSAECGELSSRYGQEAERYRTLQQQYQQCRRQQFSYGAAFKYSRGYAIGFSAFGIE